MTKASYKAPVTVTQGSHIQASGDFVRRLPDGQITVRDGDTEHTGHPIAKKEVESHAD
jgi:hypothetical protein